MFFQWLTVNRAIDLPVLLMGGVNILDYTM